jgi:hypothetical protein
LNRQIVLRIIGASACALFILSIFLPFLQVQWYDRGIPEAIFGPEALWSFKETYKHGYMGGHVVVEEYWFASYWSRGFSIRLGYWVGPFLIFMLEAQAFTVLFAVLAILKVRHNLFLSATILNAFTTFCMWFVSYAIDSWYAITFQIGFWLTFFSATLFFVAFLGSWRFYPQQKKSSISSA